MTEAGETGHDRRQARTLKQLLEAAARVVRSGTWPTIEVVAEEAMVSRATVYRYFSSAEALMAEVALHCAHRHGEPLALSNSLQSDDESTATLRDFSDLVEEDEVARRLMSIKSVKVLPPSAEDRLKKRHARRLPQIEAALTPVRTRLAGPVADRLEAILALIISAEARLLECDTFRLSREAASEAKRWAIDVLVSAALRESAETQAEATDAEVCQAADELPDRSDN